MSETSKTEMAAVAGRITRDVVSEVLGVADRSMLVDLARAVLDRDVAATLRSLAAAAERGLDLGQLARSFLALLRDIEIVAKVSEPQDLVEATADELAELQGLAATAGRLSAGAAPPVARGITGAGADLVAVLFDRWARAVDEAGRAQAPRLILEMAAVDLCQAEPLEPLGDLLDRLEALEGRIQSGGPGSLPARPLTQPVRSVVSTPTSIPRATVTAPNQGAAPNIPGNGVGGTAASGGSPADAWRRVKTELERRRPRVGALLATANVLELDATKLVLGFGDRADVDAAERVRADIEQALAAELGASVRLIVKQDSGPTSAIIVRAEASVEADDLAADKRKREQEARQHPIIQKAQDLFGAAIREIKT